MKRRAHQREIMLARSKSARNAEIVYKAPCESVAAAGEKRDEDRRDLRAADVIISGRYKKINMNARRQYTHRALGCVWRVGITPHIDKRLS